MKTTFKQSATGIALKGAAAAFLALGIAAVAPMANAQSGTLSLSNPSSCSTFNGFTWNGSTLTVTCASGGVITPPAPCDATQTGAFSWASPTTLTVQPGGSVTGTIVRTGGCKGQYTISFGTDAAAYPGVTVSPTTSVSFADGTGATTAPAMTQTVTIATSANTPVGTNVSVYLNGFSSSTGSPTPSIGGTFVASVTASPPPPVQGCTTSATYNVALNAATQLYWGTTEYDSRPALKPGETIAASFTYNDNGSWGEVDLAQVTNYVMGGTVDTEVSIDACPGNFPATTADTLCDKRVTYESTGGPVLYGFTNGSIYGKCSLTQGKQYYINVRQVKRDYSQGTAASCAYSSGCALRFRGINFN